MQEVAAPHLDVLRLHGRFEVRNGDRVAVLEEADAFVAGDVEQHAAPEHLADRVLDAGQRGAPRLSTRRAS